jgi:hypothetical protein
MMEVFFCYQAEPYGFERQTLKSCLMTEINTLELNNLLILSIINKMKKKHEKKEEKKEKKEVIKGKGKMMKAGEKAFGFNPFKKKK